MQRGRVLIVGEEPRARAAAAERLRGEGYAVHSAGDAREALRTLEEHAPDVVVADAELVDGDGALAAAVRARDLGLIVTIAPGAVERALAAMRRGAAGYLTRPVNGDELSLVAARELERKRLRAEAGQLRARLAGEHRLASIVGASPAMQRLREALLQAAASRAPVLLHGESGTGKQLVAAAIHEHGPRASRPFVKLHCAGLAEPLLDAELFGRERASVSGAVERSGGRFAEAAGGTLYLDEISELPPAIQLELSRLLGGHHAGDGDVRVIAATHHDLRARVKDGLFRQDLYERAGAISIELLPLRARASDIPLLASHFAARAARRHGKTIDGFTDEALARLASYEWPGNVRELESAVERAAAVCKQARIGVADLAAAVATVRAGGDGMPPIPGAKMDELERYAILKTLEHTGGSTSRAAGILGISARTIQYRLHQYGAHDGKKQ